MNEQNDNGEAELSMNSLEFNNDPYARLTPEQAEVLRIYREEHLNELNRQRERKQRRSSRITYSEDDLRLLHKWQCEGTMTIAEWAVAHNDYVMNVSRQLKALGLVCRKGKVKGWGNSNESIQRFHKIVYLKMRIEDL